MLKLFLMLSLSSQCFVSQMQWASKVEIVKPFKFFVSSRGADKRFLKKLYKLALNEDSEVDPRYFALSWMESRLRPFPRSGDKGKACGIYQIHSRHSYPMFHRKRGYVQWNEKDEKNKILISRECSKLRDVTYSVETLSKMLKIHDRKKKHPCHHNSGIYGKCHTWYKERLDFWMSYFQMSKLVCDTEVRSSFSEVSKTYLKSNHLYNSILLKVHAYKKHYFGRRTPYVRK